MNILIRYSMLISLVIMVVNLQVVSNGLPDTFSWGNANNITYLNYVPNQNFPHVCNSGWAFATINMLNTRIKIKRVSSGSFTPDVTLSTQVLLSCDELDFGCLGGQPITAIQWIYRNNITDESCQPYSARGYTNGLGCSSQIKCQICSSDKCKGQYRSKIYSIKDYGIFMGEADMMNEINNYGPIACGISSSDSLKNYTKGILKDSTDSIKIDHHVTVYGWGVENGVKYWNVMNSWGTSWGQQGHFRIVKGINNLGIETRCYWANLQDTWTKDLRNQTLPNYQQTIITQSNQQTQLSLPKYLVPSRSSLNPLYCQSSWAFAITTMMSDRSYKVSNGKSYVLFSVQNMLNCGVGTCAKGADPLNALQFIHKFGISEDSCQGYLAKSPIKQDCTAVSNCANCKGTLFKEVCSQVKSYKRWKIVDYQTISGVASMKSNIQSYGPIACGIFASEKFKAYEGGVFSQTTVSPKINHYVEVVGYGQTEGKQFWWVRNFWGTAWGESGFIRIQSGSNVLGIQTKCYGSGNLI